MMVIQRHISYDNHSHIGNINVNKNIPYKGNESSGTLSYYRGMAQRPYDDWFLKEWMRSKDVTQKFLQEESGWTYRITSQLVNRKTRWNRDHLMLAAKILKVRPYELLMHPDDANALKRFRAEALTVAAEQTELFRVAPAHLAKVAI
jgi:hypothetical protein